MNIESRLKRLERTNRFLFALLFVILLVGAGSVTNRQVDAKGRTSRIVADSIETRSLTVDDPAYGKQALRVTVGDNGTVTLSITDVKGKETFGVGSVNPVGEPTLCLGYRGVCRVAIGAVERGDRPEFSVELRDKHGRTIWMSKTPNPYVPSRRTRIPDNPHAPSSQ